MDDEIFKPKHWAGRWYLHATDTGWMGPHYGTEELCQAECDKRNKGLKPGPGTALTEMQRMLTYGGY